jgi:hypothetical protein
VVTVVFRVVLGGVVRRACGVQPVRMREVGVMAALLMVAVVVVLGRLAVMVRRFGVMLGGGLVMILMRVGGAHGVILLVGLRGCEA